MIKRLFIKLGTWILDKLPAMSDDLKSKELDIHIEKFGDQMTIRINRKVSRDIGSNTGLGSTSGNSTQNGQIK